MVLESGVVNANAIFSDLGFGKGDPPIAYFLSQLHPHISPSKNYRRRMPVIFVTLCGGFLVDVKSVGCRCNRGLLCLDAWALGSSLSVHFARDFDELALKVR